MIKLKRTGQLEELSFVLALKDHTHLGQLEEVDEVVCNLDIHADEISLVVYRYKQDAPEECIRTSLYEEINDFKFLYVPELDEYFEMEVIENDDDNPSKSISAVNACKVELSQTILYEFEINSERDIAREEYTSPTIFYDETDPSRSLLHRVLYKLPQYSIGHVDNSLIHIQRVFSADKQDVYSFLTQTVAEEIGCIFEFDTVNREINVYDLQTTCQDCGHRGEYFDTCPKCGSHDLVSYGTDTTIEVDVENILDSVTLSTNVDEVKNTFRLEAGDDDMTAAVVNRNPNGSQYLYYFSDEAKHDMPSELVAKLEAYDVLYQSYDTEYSTLIENIYTDIDKILYFRSGMMPTIETIPTTAADEAQKLVVGALSPVGMPQVTANTSLATVNIAMRSFAKCFIRSGFYKATVKDSSWEYAGKDENGASYGWWTGNFTVENWSDEEDVADSPTIKVKVWDKYHTYLEQTLTKYLKDQADKQEEGSIYDVLAIKELTSFKEALKLYGLNRLQSFYDAIQGCMDIMIENDQASPGREMYEEIYLPYFDKLQAVEVEINERSKTITQWETSLETHQKRQHEIQVALDFEKYLGEDLYKVFCMFKREDTYSNPNYVSADLDNKTIFENAGSFLEAAEEQLLKSGERQHQISANLINLLKIDEFKPLIDNFEIGNWIRVTIDDNVYKLRLLSAQISYNDPSMLDVTFSNVTRWRTSADDTKSVLDDAKSMASSYGGIVNQVKNTKEQANYVKDFMAHGLDATATKLVNNANNQNIIFGETGLLARRKMDFTDSLYDPYQLKLLSNGLYVTSDNWRSTDLAVGRFVYTDPDTGNQDIRMGVLAENIVGRLLLGNKLGIYSTDGNKRLSFDNFGLKLEAIESDDGIYSKIFSIAKTDKDGHTTEQMYMDTDGNLVLANKQIIEMHDKLNSVDAEIGNFDKVYVKEGTIEKLLTEYVKAEDIEGFNAEFKKLIASEAQFEDLKTNNATIYGLLQAANASIDNLTANKIDTNTFNAYKADIATLFASYATIQELEANYLKANMAELTYAKVSALTAVEASIQTLNTAIANINTLIADKADITDLNAVTAKVETLIADLADVEELLADKVTADEVDAKIIAANKVITDDLTAIHAIVDVLDVKYATLDQLNAQIARIDTLVTDKADVSQLNAAIANISTLTGQLANIESIMSGNIGTGLLQTIHLTTQNFVGDDAIITSAMIKDLTADKITSGSIDTEQVTIESGDGRMRIDGSTQQFFDENGKCRIQIGKDATGKFTFTIFDETGTGVLIDSKGVHEDAIADGLIVDRHVSSTAGIQASKIAFIDQDGSKTLQTYLTTEQGRIDQLIRDTTIDGVSLKDKLTQVTTTVNGITTTVSDIQSDLSDTNDSLTGLTSKVTTIETTADGLTARITQAETDITNANNTASAASTQATLNAGKISLLIQSGTDASNLTITPGALNAIARDINLTGKVTFTSLDTATQNKINGTLSDSVVEYAIGSSRTTAPTTGWATTSPTPGANQYVWQRTKKVTSSGATTYSTAVCISGADGQKGDPGQDATPLTITSQSVTYQKSTNGTTAPTGTWQSTIPATSANEYLWTKVEHHYSDNTTTTSYSVSRNGSNGSNGTNGTSVTISSQSVTYQASTSGVNVPTGTWSATVPNVSAGGFLWTKNVVTYSTGTSTTSYSVSYSGTNGTNGKDAITIQVTSSAGLTFKNAPIVTTLTAHVFKGGTELNTNQISSEGAIKWYLNGGTTAVGTGVTLSVNQAESVAIANYTCRLEG